MMKLEAPPARKAFARRLAIAREAAGFETAKDVALAMGLMPARYTRWERAETEPDITNLVKFQSLTGVSLDFLISGKKPTTRLEDVGEKEALEDDALVAADPTSRFRAK